MSRVLPHPLLAVAIVLMWLLLNRFSPGHLVLGIAVAVSASHAMAALEPNRPHIRRWDLVALLLCRMSVDIAKSNASVARLILTERRTTRHSGFVEIDLDLKSSLALAILAVVVTATPGTAWIDYDAARGRMLLHVFDLKDPEEWRQTIATRYGRLLKEIFE